MYELQKLLNKVVTKRESSNHRTPLTTFPCSFLLTSTTPSLHPPAMPLSLLLSSRPFPPSQSKTSGPRASA